MGASTPSFPASLGTSTLASTTALGIDFGFTVHQELLQILDYHQRSSTVPIFLIGPLLSPLVMSFNRFCVSSDSPVAAASPSLLRKITLNAECVARLVMP
ncbi:hypothetical protein SISSUDRAFT_1068207 [Sistotremastrum suecicum HHB10207 ss-3]|uniref:Uncharacterized protein n=1 Tax=Sistotremastrum suecicum HHB10207 ss-3 TaxID=1314776 RepID=A0A165WDP8_9AGAM|nr:hypothetical protein SISSUDRAFT_1068207 [Sistotremastrum suecicum HHB10207 ss-3]